MYLILQRDLRGFFFSLSDSHFVYEFYLFNSEEIVYIMATHPSILAWRIPWTEEAGRIQSMGLQELDMT